ncbi:alpha/beta fold hydrolase [Oceanobacter mangrovi]|uniref:alpha/beta fold hydrolase n=1 Tax=Oceanobacter mangrovi TaxID=2862510 RepID=UPI001C8F1D14|nr:alpha/beta fold hydrolase [Oceanobacter mangrovi]
MSNRTGKSPAGTAYTVIGEGEAVVLIHGVGLDHSIWGGQCEGLKSAFSLITYDMLGHGQSPLQNDNATLEDYAEQLLELLQHLHISKAHIVGFSMGGLVARVFAIRYPQYVGKLVIMGSVFNRSDAVRNAIIRRTEEVAVHGANANLQTALERWFSPEYRAASPGQIDQVRELVLGNDPQGYLNAYRLFAGADNYLASQVTSIQSPTLVMTGELDPGSTPAMAAELAAQLPNGRCQILAGQRHMMPMESPQLVNQVLLEFLQAKPGSQAARTQIPVSTEVSL